MEVEGNGNIKSPKIHEINDGISKPFLEKNNNEDIHKVTIMEVKSAYGLLADKETTKEMDSLADKETTKEMDFLRESKGETSPQLQIPSASLEDNFLTQIHYINEYVGETQICNVQSAGVPQVPVMEEGTKNKIECQKIFAFDRKEEEELSDIDMRNKLSLKIVNPEEKSCNKEGVDIKQAPAMESITDNRMESPKILDSAREKKKGFSDAAIRSELILKIEKPETQTYTKTQQDPVIDEVNDKLMETPSIFSRDREEEKELSDVQMQSLKIDISETQIHNKEGKDVPQAPSMEIFTEDVMERQQISGNQQEKDGRSSDADIQNELILQIKKPETQIHNKEDTNIQKASAMEEITENKFKFLKILDSDCGEETLREPEISDLEMQNKSVSNIENLETQIHNEISADTAQIPAMAEVTENRMECEKILATSQGDETVNDSDLSDAMMQTKGNSKIKTKYRNKKAADSQQLPAVEAITGNRLECEKITACKRGKERELPAAKVQSQLGPQIGNLINQIHENIAQDLTIENSTDCRMELQKNATSDPAEKALRNSQHIVVKFDDKNEAEESNEMGTADDVTRIELTNHKSDWKVFPNPESTRRSSRKSFKPGRFNDFVIYSRRSSLSGFKKQRTRSTPSPTSPNSDIERDIKVLFNHILKTSPSPVKSVIQNPNDQATIERDIANTKTLEAKSTKTPKRKEKPSPPTERQSNRHSPRLQSKQQSDITKEPSVTLNKRKSNATQTLSAPKTSKPKTPQISDAISGEKQYSLENSKATKRPVKRNIAQARSEHCTKQEEISPPITETQTQQNTTEKGGTSPPKQRRIAAIKTLEPSTDKERQSRGKGKKTPVKDSLHETRSIKSKVENTPDQLKKPSSTEPQSIRRSARVPKKTQRLCNEFHVSAPKRLRSPAEGKSSTPSQRKATTLKASKSSGRSARTHQIPSTPQTPQLTYATSEGKKRLFFTNCSKVLFKNIAVKNIHPKAKIKHKIIEPFYEEMLPLSPLEMLTLHDMSEADVLRTLECARPRLDELFSQIHSIDYIKKHEGIDHYFVMDLCSNEMQRVMMEKLSDLYERKSTPRYGSHFINVLMPEWILCIFMKRFTMERNQAIQTIEKQNAYRQEVKAREEMGKPFL